MKKKIICAILTLVMIICVVCPIAYADTEDALQIQSKSVLLMELESGTVLYEKNADEMLRPVTMRQWRWQSIWQVRRQRLSRR